MVLVAAATIAGIAVLEGELGRAYAAERDVRELARAARAWAETHQGFTLLVIPERRDGIVTTRNGQGGLVLPPVQPEALLHRVLPTLPEEIELRHAQLANGLATRLDKVRRRHSTKNRFASSARPTYRCGPSITVAGIPRHEPSSRWTRREPAPSAQWAAELRKGIVRCGFVSPFRDRAARRRMLDSGLSRQPRLTSATMDSRSAISAIRDRQWFYEFDLPDGTTTSSYLPEEVRGIHTTRLAMLWDGLAPIVARTPWRDLTVADIACHQGYFATHVARRGCRSVVAVDARAEHVADTTLMANVYGLANLRTVQADI
jgi:hypothetical protein